MNLPADTWAQEPARQTAERVARESYGRLVAFLAARSRDVAGAQDALSEAFAAALEDWPRKGCPDNPEAWLMTVARRRLIDAGRHRQLGDAICIQLEILAEGEDAFSTGQEIPDHRLALLFACTHPAIEPALRAPLMLQVVLGLDAKAIASAFLTSPSAMSKRLVRVKQKIREAGVPFRVPDAEELPARLEAVLDAIYAAFAEGWSEPGGTDPQGRELAQEAIFLARLASELLPEEPEALGLLAAMLHAEARRSARRDAHGEYVPFVEQDPARWDLALVRDAEAALRHAAGLRRIGRYQLEAALQSAHVFRRLSGVANWDDVVQLYDALQTLTGSPVVAINRALALAEHAGAAAGLAALPTLAAEPRLEDYQPYWAARAALLQATGENAAAAHAYGIAIGLEKDAAVRRFLQRRLAACVPPAPQ
ncbi:DUF6596 domain-containing protein [Niveibacterium sp. SC-1]|uniref:RNA polymerase sigma factor n=1 Tax=Niveibacterium sp. SC-1 TaxID=3135646 RepID=UPI00311DDB8B